MDKKREFLNFLQLPFVMSNKKKFNKIVSDIKKIKIQGARNVAKAALNAYFLLPSEKSKEILLKSRPTEPMMKNVLDLVKNNSEKEILKHFDESRKKINEHIFKLVKNGNVIFTHCHSTSVNDALIYSKKKGKKFEVYNTETRPLYQGRKTAQELGKAGIKVTIFVDSAVGIALLKNQGTKRVDKILIGADALVSKGIINKIGSEVVAKIAFLEKIPVYIVADSWKYTSKKVPLEQRNLNEIWNSAPKNVKIKNPAFEFVQKKYIKAVVSELGILSYEKFLKKVISKSN
jgi:translation initiation factor 2B subunit (eIF-2B alpha/beta/delta family)